MYERFQSAAKVAPTSGEALMDDSTREAIERRAYELWQAAGFPEGEALEHWLRAEREFGVPAGSSQPVLDVAADEVPSESDEQIGPSSAYKELDDPLAHTDRP